MNSKNIQHLHNFQPISNTQEQTFISAAVADSNAVNMANTTNLILNSDNEIFTSPIIAYTNTNRNNAISTPTHSLINEKTQSITIPPSAIDNNQAVFKLPEPYVSKDILYDSNLQKSNTNNIRKKHLLDSHVTAIPSSALINHFQKNLENENFTNDNFAYDNYDNLSLNEDNTTNETIEKEESFLMPSLVSPSLASDAIYQNIHSRNEKKYNSLTSPAMIPEYNEKSTYTISKVSQKSTKSHPISNSSNISSPLYITNQNNISSISNNYHLPGSIMSLASLSPNTSYINRRKNSLNSIDNATDNRRLDNYYINERNPHTKESSYQYSSKNSKFLSQSKSDNDRVIPLVSPYVLPKSKDGNDNTVNSFSPLVEPMITDHMNYESSPTVKPISKSMLPITPSVLMHLDNKQASSLARKIRNINNSKTRKQSSSSNVDIINISDMKRMLNEGSLNFTLSDMNVDVNMDSVDELTPSINNKKTNNNFPTPVYMDYIMKDDHDDIELDINLKAHNNRNHQRNENIENNPLLTPLILDGGSMEYDNPTYSSLNNTLLLSNNQDDNDITSNAAPTISSAELTRKSSRIKNRNTPISVSTIFNRYNSRNKSEPEIAKSVNTLNKNQITEAIDKLISSNKKFHENTDDNRRINIPNIVLENTSDLSKYLKANTVRLKPSHSSIPTSSLISPNGVSLSNKALTPEIIARATRPISPNHIFSNHPISPNFFPNHPNSSTSSISSSTNNSKKGRIMNTPDKKSIPKKKVSTNQSGSNSEKSVEDVTPITTNNPLILLNNSKTTPKFATFTSPSSTDFSVHLSSIPKPDRNETGTPFKSLPPPSISSNANIIHGSIANPNLSTLTTSQSSNNGITISSIAPSSIPSTPSSVASITNVASKLKPANSLKIKKPMSNPRITPLLPNKITSMDDAIKLASKSNYQNVLGGETTSLGLNPNLISGIEVRKTNHKNAEQKRRDSLKQGFENLKVVVPFISDKNPSKIMIITRSYEYICKLKENQKKHEKEIKAMKLKEKLYLEKLKSKGIDVDEFMKELEEEIVKNMEEEEEQNPSVSCSNINIPLTTNNTNITSSTSSSTSTNSSNQPTQNSEKETIPSANKRKSSQEDNTDKNDNIPEPKSKKLKFDSSNELNLNKDIIENKISTTKTNIDMVPVTSS